MHISDPVRLAAVAALAASALTVAGPAATAQARVAEPGRICLEPDTGGDAAAARGGQSGVDHRGVSVTEQRAIQRRTARILAKRDSGTEGRAGGGEKPGSAVATVPVYVHVMRDDAGNGDVTNTQIDQQIAVLNGSFAGTGFDFTLADVTRYSNSVWHQDRQSTRYRSQTRQGGANALNMWLVDFKYLGIATFPWDYSRNGEIDGIRVHYASLPGGSIADYNLGETATHEAGHWFGLYHTFQGGCTELNDEVTDTPAQASPTSGCPEGRDSCPDMEGLDPIHNYMDYSHDSCYTEFSPGQAQRSAQMWQAYRS